MIVYLLKKKKGRIYKSEACLAALAEEQGLDVSALDHDELGAPRLLTRSGQAKLFISISDTKNYWACSVSGSFSVGLDIEEARSVRASVAKKLHPLERQYLGGLEPESSEWTAELLSIWTRKESYLKFCGEGLRLALDRFSVIDNDLSYAETARADEHPLGYLQGFSYAGLTGALCTAAPVQDIDIVSFSYDGAMPRPALEKATDLLAEKDYLAAALSKKLQSLGYDRNDAESAVAELTERGYLDDSRVAASYVRRSAQGSKGIARIRSELIQKGASKETVDMAVSEYQEENAINEEERARSAVSGMRCENEKDLARIGRKLASLGYAPHLIYDILSELREELKEDQTSE